MTLPDNSAAQFLKQQPKAGDTQPFPSGQITYLAPLPLPTQHPAQDYSHAVGEMNDTYLDFGTGLPQVFGWQMLLGGPFTLFVMVTYLLPMIAALMALAAGGGVVDAKDFFYGTYEGFRYLGPFGSLCVLAILLLSWLHSRSKVSDIRPTRFNRQRREVCFVPIGDRDPIIVPWESVSAWVIQAQGVTQYGVQRQYAMGVGFHHAPSGRDCTLEFPCAGLPLAISNWEAVRAYMEYEVHSLKEVQDPLELQGPDDPPHEGLHTFRNARQRLHRRFREGEVGVLGIFGWYLYHVMTLWTLPNYMTEWDIRSIKRKSRAALPRTIQEWSQPLPPELWAKPSAELQRLSPQVKALHTQQPQKPITAIFAEVLRAPAAKGNSRTSA
ncbi:hypothetical protein [Spongiibacter sp.]|uniref:hypothetical protein n=1 Tax=Spongiibacter sp. TaxID=2024860 RepID=UPI003561B691